MFCHQWSVDHAFTISLLKFSAYLAASTTLQICPLKILLFRAFHKSNPTRYAFIQTHVQRQLYFTHSLKGFSNKSVESWFPFTLFHNWLQVQIQKFMLGELDFVQKFYSQMLKVMRSSPIFLKCDSTKNLSFN